MEDTDIRAIKLGEYIVQNKATIRAAAKYYGISKSTVHKDVSTRLKYLDKTLAAQVKDILDINKAERHLRGGYSTHLKYKGEKQPSN